MRAWRVLRVMRVHWMVLLAVCAIVAVNVFMSSNHKRNILHDHLHHIPLIARQFESSEVELLPGQDLNLSGHSKGILPKLLSVGEQQTPPAPVVKKELSFGVHEEENSAREVIDLEGSEREGKIGHLMDVDAANEVNSVEPEVNAKGANDPSQQGHHSEVDNDRNSWAREHNWRNLSEHEIKSLSVLGRRQYLNEKIGTVKNRNFTILVWKSGPSIERRLLREYGTINKDPFRKCSVNNCKLTYEDEAAKTADAIMIHLHRTKGPHTFPNRTKLSQRWIWLTDESPHHTFMMAKTKKMVDYNGYFNWSMNYRMDSDIPVPYGRTIKMTPEEVANFQYVDYFKLHSKTVAALGSNCGGNNKRWQYVRELMKYMEVDTYGGCGTLKCPGHFRKDCEVLKEYKFYLAFENGDCQQYITEKVWWNALGKGAIPVVMGAKVEDYKKLLPPESFIHINDFQTPEHLAKYLTHLASQPLEYNKFHAWRSKYKVLNEHGYFASEVFHYCRICEALNYNDPAPKVYNHLEEFWNRDTQCYLHTWQDKLKQYELTKT
ncbi:glycoprotein 3-alpha-L-fucosyltransferase A-like isoform X2 [Homarus americanus]|uniref:Fucosyltransferase n=2 Tax=Homarus americanus TaxID=6706 RepID=A0A8J5T5B2_HOMAM|nr:glycoprotein 3-alpha-L-fucosyltransferase A-like isoform X2 [Homarus americanus]XP_042214514.1 glycoprotein 3-alpha-L-fucosyltransferase A-like isoform X2 [Homarus americanus]XP_042214515.1 glycoprotein 3-alpha-L-fucosyltransferase A-like isoform X2 [Homarus americanus]XP_042214516.1 glycoprotein 3-alpha-L-fucosyltransferase A-like isoform X2 [Homarus americanus]KAG7173159.1 Glycoprotein 3-alpha-L-fucosyltransferase A-like 2 [Homarus americanus]